MTLQTTTVTAQNRNVDVTVVGAGLAGCVTAHLLTQAGFSVMLLYSESDGRFKSGESLPPQATPILKRLGLMPLLNNDTHLICPGNQSAFGGSSLIDNDFIFSGMGHGWHLDRSAFEADVFTYVSQNQTHTLALSHLIKVSKRGNKWCLNVKDTANTHLCIESQFIVDATGRNRSLLKKIAFKAKSYDRLAARCMLYHHAPDEKVDQRTLIESVPNGWWYSAPIPNNQHILMYFSDTDLTKYKAMNTAFEFNKCLKDTIYIKAKHKKLHLHAKASVLSFSAQTTLADDSSYQSNCLAVGDAAVSYDPLSSQGMWKALAGAEQTATMISNALTGKRQSIQHYADWLKQEFNHYQKLHHAYYSQEQRWKENLFWSRRHHMFN